MKLFNRSSIAKDVEYGVFRGKDVWSFIFKVREGLKFVSGAHFTDADLYTKMVRNVSEKLKEYDTTLKEVFVVINSENKLLTYENAHEYMTKIIRENLPVIFRVVIKNKTFDYQVN